MSKYIGIVAAAIVATIVVLAVEDLLQSDDPSTLFDAVNARDCDKMRWILATSPRSVESRENEHSGLSPIHRAAELGHLEAVDLLLKHGASAHQLDANFNTPLHVASRCGHTSVVARLIADKADVNARNRFDETPLILASKNGQIETIEALIGAAADFTASDRFGDCLHWAIALEQTAVAERLLKLHWKWDKLNSAGDSYIDLACYTRQKDVADLLIAAGAVLETKYYISFSSPSKIDDAAKAAKVNLCEIRWRKIGTPLHLCSKHGRTDIVRHLLAVGCDASARNSDQQTPLHVAASEGHGVCVTLLVSEDNINLIDRNGRTALHYCLRNGDVERSNYLIRHGARTNIPDFLGETPSDLVRILGLNLEETFPNQDK